MAENKTQATDASVDKFIEAVESPKKREDAYALKKMMEEVTGEKAVMWGPSIVGFGQYHYKYDSGREGDFLIVGFSPRKASISVYLLGCMENNFDELLSKLGKHKMSVSCLYINKLTDINESVLRELIKKSYDFMKEKYPSR